MNGRSLEVSCANCTGACCQNIRLALTDPEAEKLAAAGTRLTRVLPPLAEFKSDPSDTRSWSDAADEVRHQAEAATDEQVTRKLEGLARHMSQMSKEQGLYSMIGRCGVLGEDGLCGDYDNRPQVCQDFEMGGPTCLTIRELNGLGPVYYSA